MHIIKTPQQMGLMKTARISSVFCEQGDIFPPLLLFLMVSSEVILNEGLLAGDSQPDSTNDTDHPCLPVWSNNKRLH